MATSVLTFICIYILFSSSFAIINDMILVQQLNVYKYMYCYGNLTILQSSRQAVILNVAGCPGIM